jgi:hypothetical protein
MLPRREWFQKDPPSLTLVGPNLVKLTQSGVTDQDIINIAAVFEMYIAGKDRQSFISDLQVYGSLKSGIQELSKQADKLKNEVTSLETQRQYLSRYIQVTHQTWNISRRNILQEVEVAINTLEYDMGDMNPIQEKS